VDRAQPYVESAARGGRIGGLREIFKKYKILGKLQFLCLKIYPKSYLVSRARRARDPPRRARSSNGAATAVHDAGHFEAAGWRPNGPRCQLMA
jgi:hypothetical protein